MRSGRKVILSILLILSAALSCVAGEGAEEILQKIRRKMGAVSTLQAEFVQKKRIASLKHTLMIRGELALDRKGKMAWRVHSPMRYVCLIDGNSLTQWDEDSDSVLKLDVSKNPALQVHDFAVHPGNRGGNLSGLQFYYPGRDPRGRRG